jgi:Putative Flp pilus-assembly TadE/G-like
MRNLVRPLLRLLGRDDRGAIGVLVAVLIGGGVLLGMGALAIDVGQIYQNRAELQNGADAGALGIARQCAQGACPAGPVSLATTFASDNASALTQDTAKVDCVHGSDGMSGGSCAGVAGGGGLTNCPPDPPAGTHFVDVQTETGTTSSLLPPVFAETLVGSSTYNGTTVKACAQAEWGPSGGVAFTISSCEWAVATGGSGSPPQAGNRYWNPQNGVPDASYDTQFLLHQGGQTPDTGCNEGPAGQDAPGAFGWTDDPTGFCVTVVTNNTYDTSTGNSASGACKTALAKAQQSRTPVSVPIYASVTGNGNNTVYTLLGYASFVITGFHVPSDTVTDWLNPSMLCGPPDSCVDGYLTSNSLSQTPVNGPGDNSPKLTG